jgi:hypothetical protein
MAVQLTSQLTPQCASSSVQEPPVQPRMGSHVMNGEQPRQVGQH